MKKPYIFPLLLGSLVLTGCVNGQIDAMQMRLNQQEQQIRLLNSQLSGVQPAQADTWAQVQSLRQEMSAVKGRSTTSTMRRPPLAAFPVLPSA